MQKRRLSPHSISRVSLFDRSTARLIFSYNFPTLCHFVIRSIPLRSRENRRFGPRFRLFSNARSKETAMNLYRSFTLFIGGRLVMLMIVVGWLSVGLSDIVRAQKIDNFQRERGSLMLKIIKDEIKKSYYDPAFHGVDIEARFKAADEKIKTATSNGQIFGIIAQAVLDLNDSHTFFIPPRRAARPNYGWQKQMIGDKCYVVAVQPDSDADAKGLRP